MAAFLFDPPSSASSDSGSGEDQDAPERNHVEVSVPRTPTKTGPKSPTKVGKRRVRTTSASAQQEVVRYGSRTIYTAGRPPWYDTHGQLKDAFVIGICGGSASGKTTVARRIIEALDIQWVSLLSMDSFYKVLNEEQHEKAAINEYDFDHPDAFDFELLCETLQRLKEGKHVEVPVYNFTTHSREKMKKTIYGANVIIFEGIMAFADKKLLELMDMKVFVDTDSDIRLARRLKRDISERERDLEGVLHQYHKFVKPAFEHYIAPTMTVADIIVPRGGDNQIAINLIVHHVHTQLHLRGHKVRSQLAHQPSGQPLPQSLYVLPNTPQVKGLHTFVRNKDTPRDEFIFYSNRLMRLLIEHALSLRPFKTVCVDTPQGVSYEGKRVDCEKICGVSVLRAGETMEPALCAVCKDIRLGKILIQTNLDTGEPEGHVRGYGYDQSDYFNQPMELFKHSIAQEGLRSNSHISRHNESVVTGVTSETDVERDLFHEFRQLLVDMNMELLMLHYLRLPKDIKDHRVMLLEATVATGAAAMMAIRVLLDHDVPEENIMLLSLIMAASGVHSVAYAFPKVKIVTTAVDPEVNDKFHILPGIGNFGDRYFGTEPTQPEIAC